VISSLYIIAQMVGVGSLMESITTLNWQLGVIILGSVITLYVAFGGMTGVTLTQMLQFWIMITAMIVPLILIMGTHSYPEILSYAYEGNAPRVEATRVVKELDDDGNEIRSWEEPVSVPAAIKSPAVPAFTGDEAFKFSSVKNEQGEVMGEQMTMRDWLMPFKKYNLFSSISLLIALVCGTAGLPHILARFYTNPDAGKARWSTVGVLVFIGIFYITTPLWGAYGRLVLGTDAVVTNGAGVPNSNTLMFLTSFEAGEWALALVAGGAIAALLSTISGLLIALSSALAHDLYGEILKPDATDRQKMVAAKIAVLIFGAAAIAIGIGLRDLNIAWMVGLAFAVAASTFFPLLVCGIWWRHMTEPGALAGIMTGGLISAVVVIGKLAEFWTFDQPAVISVPLAFLAIFIVSKLTYHRQSEEVCVNLETAFHALHHPKTYQEREAAENGAK
jgi:Na+(H+)/acetate symporter ActP